MNKTLPILFALVAGTVSMQIVAAEQPQNLPRQIEDLAAKAQNWIDIIQGRLDTIKSKIQADKAKSALALALEQKWLTYKKQLDRAAEKAVQLFVIENMPPAAQEKQYHTIFDEMSTLMPNDKELALFDREIEKIGEEKATSPQKPSAPEQPITKPAVATTKIPVADFDVPATKKNDPQREHPLTDRQIVAGVDNESVYYNTAAIMRLEAPHGGPRALHKIGNYVDEDFLAHYFFNTIFQFYTTELTGYNLNWKPEIFDKFMNKLISAADSSNSSYDGPLTAFVQKLMLLQPTDFISFSTPIVKKNFYSYQPWIMGTPLRTAIEKFKHNKLLEALGIAYQRQKIVEEKLERLTRETDGALQNLLLKQNRFLDDLQTIIYYFMDEAYNQLFSRLRRAKNLDETKLESIGNFLIDYQPEFIKSFPYYKSIITALEKFRQPVHGQFEWNGKLFTIN